MKKLSKSQVWLGFLLVSLLTIFVWYRLLGQAFLGEGATYFAEPWASQFLKTNKLWPIINRCDLQTIIFFHIFPNFATDNMKFYFGVELLGIILVNFGVFMAVKQVTKSFLAGIIAAALFISDFVGSSNMLGEGIYIFFTQRVPNFALTLFSFVFIVKYFETKRGKYYWFSFVLYALSMLLSKYSVIFFPLLAIFISLKSISENIKNYQKWIWAVLYNLPFLLWNLLFLIKPSISIPDKQLFQFFWEIDKQQLIMNSMSRLTIMTLPRESIIFFANVLKSVFTDYFRDSSASAFSISLSSLSFVVTALYLATAGFIVAKFKNLRIPMLSISLMIPVSILTAIYLRPSVVLENVSSRDLYLPAMIVSIFWGVVFYLMIIKGKISRVFIIIFLVCFFMYQRSLILKNFDRVQPYCDEVLSSILFIKSNYKSFPDNSLIILTKSQSLNTHIFDRFYGERNIIYLNQNDDLKAIAKQRALKNQQAFKMIYSSGKISLQKVEIK